MASQQFVGLTGPFRYFFIAWMAMIVVFQWWLPPGRPGAFRMAVNRGAWWVALGVLASLGMLAFAVAVALGHEAIAIAALIVAAPPSWFLYIRVIRHARQPERGNQTPD